MEGSQGENSKGENVWLFKARLPKIRSQIVETWSTAKKVGEDDPWRIVHGAKVGLAIALIAVFYYFDPLYIYDGFGLEVMWAVLTVVVVFEFSVGATFGKGVNRVVSTAFGASLGVGAHNLAMLSGEAAYHLVFFLFIVASVVTFLRFFPELKARHDYGLMIVILTFSLICVSGDRAEDVVVPAQCRISSILVGTATALATCLLICPVWAGEDLHILIANNLHKLAHSLEVFGQEYFYKELGAGTCNEKQKEEYMEGFNDVLNSKCNEDSLVNMAKWEPPHGRFRYGHPWEEYLKIGSLTRQCARTLEVLSRYLPSDGDQTQKQVKAKLEDICKMMSRESVKALKQVSTSMKNWTIPSLPAKTHIDNAQMAAESLDSLLQTSVWPDHHLSDNAVNAVTVALLLCDVVSSTARITDSVRKIAPFKESGERGVGESGAGQV